MTFPRIKEFDFKYSSTYKVPSHLVGRLDKIAFELYEDYSFYKPLAAANNIKLSSGCRTGIRPIEESLKTELKLSGVDSSKLDEIFEQKMSVKRISDLDWYNYFDVSYGYISEVYENRVLLVPTVVSATEYLKEFQFI